MKVATKAPPNIIQALQRKVLFKGLFDAPSWRPWIVFLKALFAISMTSEELALYRHHTGRQRAPEKPFREAALVCGRRGGKSRILALVGVFLGAVLDWTPYIAPGEIPTIAIIAADRRQAKVILSYVAGLLHAAPGLEAMIQDELAESIVLTNGVTIEIHTGSVGAPRGRTFVAVLADEIAFWVTGTDAANPDRDIIAAVRPGLASLPGSILLLASSPYAKRGVLYETFTRYFGKDDASVLVWRGTTQEMNSGIDPHIIEEAYATDPESAAAEYGAEFRGDVSDFLDHALISGSVDAGLVGRPPQSGIEYLGAVDASGGRGSAFAFAVAHMEDTTAVLDCLFERRAPFVSVDVVEEVAVLAREYSLAWVVGDNYAAGWVSDAFTKVGLGYRKCERNRSAIYLDFLPLATAARTRLLDSPRLIYQLTSLERRTSVNGRDSVTLPPGGADDVANAAALALVTAANEAEPSLIRTQNLLAESGVLAVLPVRLPQLFVSVALDASGRMASVFWGTQSYDRATAPLWLLDFAIDNFGLEAVRKTVERLREIERTFGARSRLSFAICDAPISQYFQMHDLDAVPFIRAELQDIALCVAVPISERRVQIAQDALDKSRAHPLGAALQFRFGHDDDFLARAVLHGLVVGLRLEEQVIDPQRNAERWQQPQFAVGQW